MSKLAATRLRPQREHRQGHLRAGQGGGTGHHRAVAAAQARPARMADNIRGHWGIEALHYIRDVTLAEDASQVCTRTAPRAMASLRNLAIAALGAHGHRTIAAALRYSARDATRVLPLLGIISP
jgi:predicted transposase YbfD/YdcC